MKVEGQFIAIIQGTWRAAFNRCTIGDSANTWHIDRNSGTILALRAKPADHQITLGNRIHLPVGTF